MTVMESGWIFTDAHTHIGSQAEQRERNEARILSLVCGSTPREAEHVVKMGGRYAIPTCGLHPWHAAKYRVEEMAAWMEQCPVIGEIGMDSVWCQVPLEIQEKAFRRQLKLACEAGKPVILHTKGQEKRIAGIIREYPNRYLVHWYSCDHYLKEFLALDCYFSIGPDVWWNPAVRQVAEDVPADRILAETDGLDSVRWAWEEGRKALGMREAECCGELSTASALACTLRTIAKLRHISCEEAGRRCRDNLIYGFLGMSGASDSTGL